MLGRRFSGSRPTRACHAREAGALERRERCVERRAAHPFATTASVTATTRVGDRASRRRASSRAGLVEHDVDRAAPRAQRDEDRLAPAQLDDGRHRVVHGVTRSVCDALAGTLPRTRRRAGRAARPRPDVGRPAARAGREEAIGDAERRARLQAQRRASRPTPRFRALRAPVRLEDVTAPPPNASTEGVSERSRSPMTRSSIVAKAAAPRPPSTGP